MIVDFNLRLSQWLHAIQILDLLIFHWSLVNICLSYLICRLWLKPSRMWTYWLIFMQQSSAVFVLVIDSNVTEDSVLLGHDSASVGNRIPVFRGSILSSCSRVKTSKKNSWLFSIYVWAYCVASQCWNPFTSWHRIMFQKNGNLRV
jgi:hypothetical protein